MGDTSGAKVLRACAGLGVLTGKLLCFSQLFILGLSGLLSLELADCRALVRPKQWAALL